MSAEKSRPLPGAASANGNDDTARVTPAIDKIECIWPSGLTIGEDHDRLLAGSAIDLGVARAAGVYSAAQTVELPPEFRHYGPKCLPALVFRYSGVGGEPVPQVRPDKPWTAADGSTAKYLFPSGAVTPVAVHPLMQPRVMNGQLPLIVVEGTRQYLAAVSALRRDDSLAAIGMSGCWGWSHDKRLTPSWRNIPLNGRTVYLLLDADRTSNSKVFDAAKALAEQLTIVRGVAEIRFCALPASGTAGLDDVLAQACEAERAEVLYRILSTATDDPGDSPAVKGGRYFDRGSLKVRTLADDIRDDVPLAVGADGLLYLYQHGVYVLGRELIRAEVAKRLDERYRPTHANTVVDYLTSTLTVAGLMLPTRTSGLLLNVRNGMLDLKTLELRSHDPSYLSAVQLPVPWEPLATAPTYEGWVKAQAGLQVDDLEETASTMLDPSRAPTKAPFLFGPTRSGKSTFLRLMVEVAGQHNSSSVTLQQLASNRFAAAGLYGKTLNCAADLSSRHVDDLATFKLLTGGDPVFAENKFAHPFTFTNQALIVFSANEVPSVGETSNAYLERIKPFEFNASFAGREDPAIEKAMLAELPGILVRWVQALRRLRQRGAPRPTVPEVAAAFANRSDRVRMFLNEMTMPDEVGVTRKELYGAFRMWSSDAGGPVMGRNKFIDRIRLADVIEYKHRTRGMSFKVKLVDPDRPDATEVPTDSDSPQQGPAAPGEPGHGDSCDSSSPTSSSDHGNDQERRDLGVGRPGTVTTATVVFDLETADADRLFTYQPHDAQGFVRLAASDGNVTTHMPDLLAILDAASEVVGHNILGFDLQALARHHGADYRKLAAKSRDTLVLARLADPPLSRQTGRAESAYSLDALASRHLSENKTGDLRPLRCAHGGFDRIPLDDPKYRGYALQDVHLTERLAELYPMTPYGAREHQVLAIAGEMTLRGFRLDEKRLDFLLTQQRARREQLMAALPVSAPLATHRGKQQLAAAFADLGVGLPCGTNGVPKIGRSQMDAVITSASSQQAVALAEHVRELNGQRSLLDQVRSHTVNGRVHVKVDAGQATGRWSLTNPGLTTLGKRGRLQEERAVFLPEPGEAILVADLSQIDPRAVAAHCQDLDFLDLFLPGRDFHLEVATQVLGDAGKRDTAKKLNNSVNYGVGVTKLSETTGLAPAVCQDYLDGMAARYPRWAQWRRDTAEQVKAGVLLDNGFGRKLRVDPQRASTAGPAAVGQSCARDLMMEGLLRMDAVGLTPMLRCVVHDEVVLSVPAQDYDEVGRLVLDCLSFEWAPTACSRPVAVTAELGPRPGKTWAEAYG